MPAASMTSAKYSARLPSEKKKRIRIRDFVIVEIDNAFDVLDPPSRKELLNFIRDYADAIYTQNEESKERLQKVLPEDLQPYVIQAPDLDSFEYGSGSQTDKHFFDRVLQGRKPEDAILIANNFRYILNARKLKMLTVSMPWGKYSVTESARYVFANVGGLQSLIGRKI
jgi:hypothetical protein